MVQILLLYWLKSISDRLSDTAIELRLPVHGFGETMLLFFLLIWTASGYCFYSFSCCWRIFKNWSWLI